MDVSQYLEIFIDETKEHLQSLNEHLLILEKEPENENTINEIFRAAHSLKGMAGTMGFKRMQRLTHDMENVFSEIRNGKMRVEDKLVDILFQCLDALEAYSNNIQQTTEEGDEDNEAIIQALNNTLDNEASVQPDNSKQKIQSISESAPLASENKYEKKYMQLNIADFEKHAMNEASALNLNVYAVTVYLQETCVLKAARAFLVFKAIEEIGEIMKAEPSVQDIEDEKFSYDFSLYIISKESLEKVLHRIQNISEIDKVIGEKIEVTYDPSLVSKKETSEKTNDSKDNTTAKAQTQKSQTNKPVSNRTVRVDIEKLDVLMNLVSELIIAKNSLVSASDGDMGQDSVGLKEQIEYLESVTTNLHESVMKVRMVPIENVLNRFPRMIRDISKKLNKKMELYITGEETELDRTVIDEIGDPLMHLLRNSADHGLETPDVRLAHGKNEVGSIFLDAYQDGNNVVIDIRDDGNGIDVENVKQKAIERGTITVEQAETMDDKEIVNLLFLPSFSMAKQVTDISGRGVGLDVVKSKVEALGGDVEVKTKLGEGSIFTIRLPLTLAIIQALMVEVGEEKYAIALGSIQTIEDIPVSDIKYIESKEVIHLRETVIPLIRMNKVLDVPEEDSTTDMTVVIVKKGERLAGLVVDNLIGQQEIVIKSLGRFINGNKVISGATILGDGEVALIIDTNALI